MATPTNCRPTSRSLHYVIRLLGPIDHVASRDPAVGILGFAQLGLQLVDLLTLFPERSRRDRASESAALASPNSFLASPETGTDVPLSRVESTTGQPAPAPPQPLQNRGVAARTSRSEAGWRRLQNPAGLDASASSRPALATASVACSLYVDTRSSACRPPRLDASGVTCGADVLPSACCSCS